MSPVGRFVANVIPNGKEGNGRAEDKVEIVDKNGKEMSGEESEDDDVATTQMTCRESEKITFFFLVKHSEICLYFYKI